jgi:peptidoglycan/LPS O-acetylase OafA/YrhL
LQTDRKLIPVLGSHKNNFDFLRLVLALTVIYTHSFVIYQGAEHATEPLWNHSLRQLSFGTAALNFFFVISGFLVLQSYERSKGATEFLIKRVLRIYPGFLMVCILCALFFAPLGTGAKDNPFSGYFTFIKAIDWPKFWSASLLLFPLKLPPSFVHLPLAKSINGAIWTIWYEFIFYLLVMLFGMFGVYKKKWMLISISFVFFLLNCIHYPVYSNYNINYVIEWKIGALGFSQIERILNLEHFSMFFFAGACFYYYRDYIISTRFLTALAILVLVVTIRWIKVFELAQAVFGSYLLFWVAFYKKIRLHNFAKYGDYSYGTYLYGWPVQQLVMYYFGAGLTLYGTMFLSLALVIPFAMFSWYFVEKPFLNLKKASVRRLRTTAG